MNLFRCRRLNTAMLHVSALANQKTARLIRDQRSGGGGWGGVVCAAGGGKGRRREVKSNFLGKHSKGRHCNLVPALNIGNTGLSLQLLNLVHCYFTVTREKN